MGPITKQDVQNIINIAQNRIIDRVATKQDIATLSDTVRTVMTMQQQCQQLLKQSEYQRLQLTRRAIALEARLGQLENEIRNLHGSVSKMSDQKPQQIIIPTPLPVDPEQPIATQQYLYRPN